MHAFLLDAKIKMFRERNQALIIYFNIHRLSLSYLEYLGFTSITLDKKLHSIMADSLFSKSDRMASLEKKARSFSIALKDVYF